MARKRKPAVVSFKQLSRTKIIRDEVATIVDDYIRQYVGQAIPASSTSGVFLQKDRILLTQTYLDMYGYDLYDEIERDPHVSAVLMSRKLSVAGLDWYIDPASKSKKDQAIADFVTEKLNQIPNITQDYVELQDAVGKGFAVSEIIWDVNSSGEVVPVDLMNRPQRRFQFNAEDRALKLRTIGDAFYGVPVPDRKFIVHRNSQKYENPFGDAIDQRIYWMWFFKRNMMRFWMQFGETGSAPIPLVKHPVKAGDQLKEEAMNIAKNLRAAGYGRIPANFEVLWAEAAGKQSTAEIYEKFVRFCNDEISKAVLGQILTTEGSSSTGNGSKALGKVHESVKKDLIEYDARCLADTITSSLVKWLVDFNFNVKEYPKFRFDIAEPVDAQMMSAVIKNLKDSGFTVDREWVESTLGVQLVDEEPPLPAMPAAPVNTDPTEENQDAQDQAAV